MGLDPQAVTGKETGSTHGLGKMHRTPWFLRPFVGFPVNCPIIQFWETITKRKALKHKMRIDV
jgi:hypothetical protein